MKAKKPMPTSLFLIIVLAMIASITTPAALVLMHNTTWPFWVKVVTLIIAAIVAVMIGFIMGDITCSRYFNGRTTSITRQLERDEARRQRDAGA